MKKPKKVSHYEARPQQGGNYKVVEFYYFEGESQIRKRTLRKNLNFSTAEDTIYKLERGIR